MEIPMLKDICIGKIATHVWSTHVPPQLVVTYVINTVVDKDKPFRPLTFMQLLKKVETTTDLILSTNSIPKHLRIQVSLCFVNLMEEMIEWCTMFRKLLSPFFYKATWLYFIHKTMFTPVGKVDRARTVIRVLFDTYGNIEIRHQYAKIICFITPDIFKSYMKNNKYIRSKSLVKKIRKIVNKMTLTNHTSNKFQQKLKRISSNLCLYGTVEQFDLCYNAINESEQSSWLCKYVHSLSNEWKQCHYADKIIFIYHHLDDKTWQKVLKQNYLTIIFQVFLTGRSDYCLVFYKQIMSMKSETSIEILENFFCEISSSFNSGGHRKVIKENHKYILLKLWDSTPDSLKKDFINNGPVFIDKCGYIFANLNDYNLCSVFIKDKVHSEEDKTVLMNYLILYTKVLNKNRPQKTCVADLLEDFKIQGPILNENTLKALLLRCAQWIFCAAASDEMFGDSIDINTFKENISKDKKFLIAVLSNFHSMEDMDILIPLHNFLLWCFQSVEPAMDFVMQHVANSDAMIKIYCDYFPRLRMETNRKVFVLDHIFMEKSLALGLRKNITNPNFFPKTLELIMKKGDPNDLFHYLKHMCNAKEKEQIIESYLCSESGLKNVLERYVHTKYGDCTYYGYKDFLPILKAALKFRRYWLYSSRLKKQFGKYMAQNSKKIYKKYFEVPTAGDLLPNESVRAHKLLVNAHYKILMSFIVGQIGARHVQVLMIDMFITNLNQIAQRISRGLSIANII